jgi:hypothetical protein
VHTNSPAGQVRVEAIFKRNGARDIVSASEAKIPDERPTPTVGISPA